MLKIKTSVISAIFSIIILIGFGTWAYTHIEGWTYAQSFYFSVSTLTTVGYGDEIVPTTDGSRVFTAIYILVGVGVVIAALTSIGSKYLSTQEKELSNNISKRIKNQRKKSRKRKIWHSK
jgi:voltage-gated potassium channel Kch